MLNQTAPAPHRSAFWSARLCDFTCIFASSGACTSASHSRSPASKGTTPAALRRSAAVHSSALQEAPHQVSHETETPAFLLLAAGRRLSRSLSTAGLEYSRLRGLLRGNAAFSLELDCGSGQYEWSGCGRDRPPLIFFRIVRDSTDPPAGRLPSIRRGQRPLLPIAQGRLGAGVGAAIPSGDRRPGTGLARETNEQRRDRGKDHCRQQLEGRPDTHCQRDRGLSHRPTPSSSKQCLPRPSSLPGQGAPGVGC